MARKYVTCPKCGHRSDRAGGRRKCQGCKAELPKLRVTAHKRKLRDVGYAEWERVSDEIHGTVWEYGACGVCGRMPLGNRHDRDHDHVTGEIRGLACTGQFGCNAMMPKKLTAYKARRIAMLFATGLPLVTDPYLPRDLTAERAEQIASYLERVEAHYLRVAVSA